MWKLPEGSAARPTNNGVFSSREGSLFIDDMLSTQQVVDESVTTFV